MKKYARLVLAVVLSALLIGAPAFASVTSNPQTVNLTLTIGETLTLSVTPGSVSFPAPDINGNSTASQPISVVTSWNFSASRILVTDAYFTNPAAALTNSGPAIPASMVFASPDGGTAQACTQTESSNPNATAGGSCPRIFSNLSATSGSSTDSLQLSLRGATGLTPGAYAGVLNFSAFAN